MKHSAQNILSKTKILTLNITAKAEIISVSSNIKDVLGYDSDKVKGKSFYSINDKSDLLNFKDIFSSFIAGSQTDLQTIIKLKHKDSSILRGIITLSKDDNADIIAAAFIPSKSNNKTKEIHDNTSQNTYLHAPNCKEILNKFPAFVRQHDPDGKCIYMNATLINYTQGILSKPNMNAWTENIHPEDIEDFKKQFVSGLNQKRFYRHEYRLKHNTGAYRWVTEFGRPFYNESIEYCGVIASIFDTHEEKNNRKQLKKSESRYRSMVENQVDPICRWKPDTTLTFANNAYCTLLGKTESDLLGTRWIDYIQKEKQTKKKSLINDLNKNPRIISYEDSVINNKGDKIWLNWMDVPLFDINGSVFEFQSIARDITETKKAEIILKENEQRIQSIFRIAPTGIGVLIDRVFMEVNQKFCEMLGYTQEEILGKSSIMIYPSKEEFDFVGREKYRQIEKMGTGVVETKWKRKDGAIIDVLLSSTPLDRKNISKGITFTALDITKRKQAEQALIESEEKYRSIYENTDIAILLTATDGTILSANDYACKLFGYSEEEFCKLGRNRLVDENDIRLTVLLEERKRTGKSKGELTFIKSDGTKFPGGVSSVVFKESDDKNLTTIIIQDLTEQKQYEAELQEREVQFRNLANSGLALIWTSGTDKLCNYFNEPWLRFTGRTMEQEMGNGWAEGVHPEDFDRCLDTYLTAFDKQEEFEMEYRLRHVSGEYKWLLDLGSPNYNSAGEFIGYIGHCFDISEIKKAEKALRESEEKLSNILSHMEDVVWSLSWPDLKILYLSPSVEKLYGRSIKEFKADSDLWIKITHPDDRHIIDKAFEELKKNGSSSREVRILHKDGSVLWIQDKSKFIYDDNNKPIRLEGIASDITKRKNAENELIESNRRYNQLAKQSRTYTWEIDTNGIFTFISPVVELILGYKPEELIGKVEIWDLMPEAVRSEYKEHGLKLIKNRETLEDFENPVLAKNGKTLWVISNVIPLIDNDNLIAYRGSATDITEKKFALERLTESEEKYRLIAESTSDMVWTTDYQLNTTYVSPSVERLLGETPEKHMKKRIEDKFPPDSLAVIVKVFNEELEKERDPNSDPNRSAIVELQQYHANGSLIWVEFNMSFLRDRTGSIVGIHGVSRDISQRKMAEDMLRNYEKIYNHSHDMLCIIGTDGYLKVLNPSWKRTLGWSDNELLSMPWIEFVHKEDQKHSKEVYDDAVSGNKVLQHRNRFFCENGDIKWLSWDFIPHSIENTVIGVARDISENVNLENEKNLFHNSLIERVKEITFLNSISNLIYGSSTDIPSLCKKIVDIMPSAFQFTDSTFLSITANGIDKKTNGYKTSKHTLFERIQTETYGELIINVNIVPPENQKQKVILDEEKSMLKTLADMLNNYIQKAEALYNEKHSNEKYQELFNSVKDIVFNTDKYGNIHDINKEFEKQLGYNIKDEINIFRYLTQKSSRELKNVMLDTYKNFEELVLIDLEVVTNYGSTKIFEANLKVNYDYENKPIEIFGIARDLTKQRATQNLLMKAIIDTEERERKHFAEELHDGIGPLLSGIKMYIEKIQNQDSISIKDKKLLKYCNELVSDSISQIRGISNNLMPTLLEKYGLTKSINAFTGKINPLGVVTIVVTGDNVAAEDIPNYVSIILYRSITEMINNTLKHSNAKIIKIDTVKNSEKIVVSYTDNGNGFYLSDIHLFNGDSGLGIRNIKSKVASLNGTVEFLSEDNKRGFSATIEIPLSPKQKK
ncbi:MAG: PAS domain S-box protein [Bacteroidota bacterium]